MHFGNAACNVISISIYNFCHKSPMTFRLCILLALIGITFPFSGALTAQDKAGAFIIVSIEGDVQVKDAAGEVVPAEDVAVGKSLFEGQTLVTAENAKVLLLLSNGTMVTLDAKGELLLDQFQQEPFELDADTMVNDLETEPSKSNTKLKLGYGELLFNVKKLNAGSAFDIESPVGNAGIRGTDGQLNVTVDPQTGNFSGGLNMLSGVVAFSSPAGDILNVNAGQGVQAQATPTGQQVGQVQEAPVPPAVTQEMTQATDTAKVSTADIRVGQVSEAVQDVKGRIEQAPPRKTEGSSDETKTKPESKEDRQQGNRRRAQAPRRERTEELLEVDDQANLAQQGIIEKDPNAAKKMKSLGLGQNDLRKLRKLDSADRKDLVSGLSEMDSSERKSLLSSSPELIAESIKEMVQNSYEIFGEEALKILSGYSAELQQRIRNDLDPDVARSLLLLKMDEAEMAQSVTDLGTSKILNVLPVSEQPQLTLSKSEDEPLHELMALVEAGGNPVIVDVLLEIGGGTITEALLEFGREANLMLSDVQISGRLEEDRIVNVNDIRDNPFFSDTLSLADFFLEDGSISDDQVLYAHVSKISNVSGPLDLYDFYQDRQFLSIAATDSILISGEVELDPLSTENETYLSLLSAGSLGFEKDSTVIFLGDNLHVGSWESMDIVNVSMESGKSLTIQTMEDLFITKADLRVREPDEIFLSAQRDLMLNTVNFPDNIRNIYLEATTIDLQNINFPGGSQVDMTTLYGGLEGKYPTFPGDPRQVGRVNFIENVRYNQNLMNTKAQFDQHGQNIHIHAIQP